MIEHPQASLLLPEYLKGRLAASEAQEIEAHRKACAECRAAEETFELLAETLRAAPSSRGATHPSGGAIVAHVLDRAAGGKAGEHDIAAHLAGCPTCAEEVAATRAAVDEAAENATDAPAAVPRLPRTGHRPPYWGLMAAAVAAVFAYPAWQGLIERPRVAREAKALRAANQKAAGEIATLRAERDAATPWAGGLVGAVYMESVRGEGGGRRTPILRLRPDQPFATLLIEPSLPVDLPGDVLCRIEITGEAGGVAWSTALTAGDIRVSIEAPPNLVSLVVPRSALRPGRHALRLVVPGTPGWRPILSLPFEVAD